MVLPFAAVARGWRYVPASDRACRQTRNERHAARVRRDRREEPATRIDSRGNRGARGHRRTTEPVPARTAADGAVQAGVRPGDEVRHACWSRRRTARAGSAWARRRCSPATPTRRSTAAGTLLQRLAAGFPGRSRRSAASSWPPRRRRAAPFTATALATAMEMLQASPWLQRDGSRARAAAGRGERQRRRRAGGRDRAAAGARASARSRSRWASTRTRTRAGSG